MKDELPDLTPYLSKKGGQNQGRAATPAQNADESEKIEAPVKADLSSKLSALVKKPGSTGTNVPALTPEDIARASGSASQSQLPAQPPAQTQVPAQPQPQAQAQGEPAASPPRLAVPPTLNSSARMAVPSSDFLSVPSNSWGGAALPPQPKPSDDVAPFDEEPPGTVSNDDLLEAEPDEALFDPGPQHGSGSFSGRLTSERPRPMMSTGSIDKFRAPQAKPLTTLSSAGTPLLKAPAKTPPRPQPQQYRSEPREGVAPKAPERSPHDAGLRPQPGPSAPLQSGAMPALSPSQAIPTATPSPAPAPAPRPSAPPAAPVKPGPAPAHQTAGQPPVPPAAPGANLSSSLFDDAPVRDEKLSEADKLARAFREEAQALANAGEASEDVNKALYSDYDERDGRALGFGNLLGAVEQSSEQHSALADLMIPTGEHQTLFERERKQIDESFDEPAGSEPIRMSEKAQAPAFSSLLSDEIVTSGHDYSLDTAEQSSSDFSPERSPLSDSFSETSSATVSEPKDEARQGKSMAIGKLLEAVNRTKPEEAPEEKSIQQKSSEADEVARMLAQVEAQRDDDKEVSLDELKSLLKKEKAAKKAAKLAEAQGAAPPAEAKPEPVQEAVVKETFEGSIQASNQASSKAAEPAEKKTGLGSLLSGAGESEFKSEFKPEPKKPEADTYAPRADEPEPIEGSIQDTLRKARIKAQAEERLASGGQVEEEAAPTLGDAVADAIDKLLTAPGASASPFASPSNPQSEMLEKVVEAASIAPLAEPDPLTMTQSKVDALSRLLEVASKAPERPAPDEKPRPSDSASKLAEMINKPPGRVSRQNQTLEPPDYVKPQEGVTSPFGGSSPFTSPFATPASSITNQPAQSMPSPNQSVQGAPPQAPQAPISTDAVSARIAALNRKLDEQRRPPTASMNSQAAMSSSNLNQVPQMSAPPMSAPPMANPMPPGMAGMPGGSANSAGNVGSINPNGMPPGMPTGAPEFSEMDEPASKSELVTRILGQAKLQQMSGTTDVRPMTPDSVSVDQVQQMRSAKSKEKKAPRETNKVRAKSMRPSLDPRLLVGLLVLVIVGAGVFAFIKFGPAPLKQEIQSSVSNLSGQKLSVDQYIKNGDFDKARELLEAKQKSLKITSSEAEKLYGVYYSLADKKAADSEEADAIKILEKIPSKSKKYKDARKLMSKLKKKVKKN